MCVTGAGGYLASWVVKYLLSRGYKVHGTVRDPDDKKNAHLKKLDNAADNLQLFKADLLDYDSLCAAIAGCSGVLHVACPVPSIRVLNPEVELLEPSVTGTRNVLSACIKAKVKKVVVVSSIGAIIFNPNWPQDQLMDEDCWSDKEFCRTTPISYGWYCLAKTIAESEAFEYAKANDLNLVSVCPSVIIGPMLQSTLNASSLLLLAYMKDGIDSVKDETYHLVDVRDVAESLILTYEESEVEGRYICSSFANKVHDLVDKLKQLFPSYHYPRSFTEVERHVKLSSEKLLKLGWKYRRLEESLVDTVSAYKEKGFLL